MAKGVTRMTNSFVRFQNKGRDTELQFQSLVYSIKVFLDAQHINAFVLIKINGVDEIQLIVQLT